MSEKPSEADAFLITASTSEGFIVTHTHILGLLYAGTE
jgi:hypothetical protein